ncbi:tetratricopeptide repeat protein [Botrimarina sp.]|uniref:tetratricopeptide repeat protein n=1 Tax=Botrimarina sp. TaxID=2795802 RepID=UPI0032EE2169
MPSDQTLRRPASRLAVWLAILALASGCALTRRDGRAEYVDHAKQMWRRGVAALESGRVGEAESLLRQAAEAAPDDPAAQRHLAEALWQSGRHDEAILRVEQACECAPHDIEATIRAGQMRLSRGDADAARRWANRALDLDARCPDAWALRGRSLAHTKQPGRALADLQHALRYAPGDARLLEDLARLHGERGDQRRRLTTLHQLLDAYPPGQEPARVLADAGETYLALGRPRDAADALRVAAAREPSNAELLYRLAEAQAASGETRLAIVDARRALDVDAAHEPSRRLLARLESAPSAQLR